MAEPRPRTRPIRVFFALWPDAAVARRMHEAARAAHDRHGGRVMRRDGLHLTLAFIGEIPRARLPALAAVADRLRPPATTLTLDRYGYWRHNRIVWLGAQHPPAELTDFAGRFAEALRAAEFAVEKRPFAPHVTLLRNAGSAEPPALEPIVWPLEGFALVASVPTDEGSRYRVLAHWPSSA